jgi:hypothetical protein
VAVVCKYVERTFVSCNNLCPLLLQLTKILSTYVHTTDTSYYNLKRSSPHMYIQLPQVITTYKGPLHICTYNSHKLLQLTKILSTYVHTIATSYYNLQRSSPYIYKSIFVSCNNLWLLYVHMWRGPL